MDLKWFFHKASVLICSDISIHVETDKTGKKEKHYWLAEG